MDLTALRMSKKYTDKKVAGISGGGGTVEVDPTLTQEGMAADAKAVGDKVKELTEEMTNIQTALAAYIIDVSALIGGED